MDTRMQTLMSEYKPVVSLMVYQTKNTLSGEGEYYLESHDITEDGKVMEGKPLKEETLQGIVGVFFDERKNLMNVAGMIPEGLLQFKLLPGGNYKMVWYRPEEIRVLHHAKQLKITTGKAWVPPMVYVADKNQLSVYALAIAGRPKENTRLFLAPFFNVGDDGSVCLGNARVKKPIEKTYLSLMQYWEDLFWLSEFSHVNGSKKVKSEDLAEVWRRLLKSKTRRKWSDIDELISYKKITLNSLLS